MVATPDVWIESTAPVDLEVRNISTVWHETQKCSLSALRCKDADLLFVYEYIILSTRKIKALHALRCVE